MAQEVIKEIHYSDQVIEKNPQNVTKLSKIRHNSTEKIFPAFSQKGLTLRFNGTRFLRLQIYQKEMTKLHFLRIFEKATFF